jgi:hypothetical protein
MKTQLLSAFFPFLVLGSLSAQPVLQNDVFPQPGIQVTYTDADSAGVDPGTAGANQFWDFTDLQPLMSSLKIEYKTPDATPNGNAFPNATLAGKKANADGQVYSYFLATQNELNLLGTSDSAGASQFYSNPELILEVPLAYNGAYMDEFASYTTLPDNSLTSHGVKTVVYDGYGTLKTPAGIFNNAMRLKINTLKIDTVNLFAGYSVTRTKEITYEWFVPGRPGPEMIITTDSFESFIKLPNGQTIIPEILPSKTVTYVSGTTTGIQELSASAPNWTLSMVGANPVITGLHLNVDLPEVPSQMLLMVTDFSGHLIYSQTMHFSKGENPVNIDVEDIPAGNYTATVSDGRSLKNLKWQKM